MTNSMPNRQQISSAVTSSQSCVLVLNAGSSSVKFALFSADQKPLRHLSGAVDGVGRGQGRFHAADATGSSRADEVRRVSNQEEAIELVLSSVARLATAWRITAVGHRIVHGGPDCDCPEFVTPELEDRLRKLIPLAPLHLPHNLAGIAAVRAHLPDLPQVACFDTAFHETLPKLARMTGLPRDIAGKDIRRYGFHGLSYEFIVDDLRRTYGDAVDDQRLIVAHLGNGASMAAIKSGRSIETTMGFSTLAGLPMGTRSGDLDPGIVLYLLMEKGLSAETVQHMLYERSGLLGISGASSDMRELLGQVDRPDIAEAIEYFCTRARAYIGSLAATLGGLDRLVFTGGIGANAPEIRERICEGLGFLGIGLDPVRNEHGERAISRDESKVRIEAFPTDEEAMIARHTVSLMRQAVAQEA
ncbi:MAG: acetate/propionate family kinase [Pseudomonadota bacterium]